MGTMGFTARRLSTTPSFEGINTPLMCGFVTNVCVEGTAFGAHERGLASCW